MKVIIEARELCNKVSKRTRTNLYKNWLKNPDIKQKELARIYQLSEGTIGNIIREKLTKKI